MIIKHNRHIFGVIHDGRKGLWDLFLIVFIGCWLAGQANSDHMKLIMVGLIKHLFCSYKYLEKWRNLLKTINIEKVLFLVCPDYILSYNLRLKSTKAIVVINSYCGQTLIQSNAFLLPPYATGAHGRDKTGRATFTGDTPSPPPIYIYIYPSLPLFLSLSLPPSPSPSPSLPLSLSLLLTFPYVSHIIPF